MTVKTYLLGATFGACAMLAGFAFASVLDAPEPESPPAPAVASVTDEFNEQCIAAGGFAIPTANGAAVCLTDFQIESVEP